MQQGEVREMQVRRTAASEHMQPPNQLTANRRRCCARPVLAPNAPSVTILIVSSTLAPRNGFRPDSNRYSSAPMLHTSALVCAGGADMREGVSKMCAQPNYAGQGEEAYAALGMLFIAALRCPQGSP